MLCFNLCISFVFLFSFGPFELLNMQMSHMDLEQGSHHNSVNGRDLSMGFFNFDDGSCQSYSYSTNDGLYYDDNIARVCDPEVEGAANSRRASSTTDLLVKVEIESGDPEIKVHLVEVEKDCRICHLGLESDCQESGAFIRLGCSCKDDLSIAHKNCAETWFKIKGSKTCEICHSVAQNVYGENEETTQSLSGSNNATEAFTISTHAPLIETQRFWHDHRFLNRLFACILLVLVISWIFHFKMPSS